MKQKREKPIRPFLRWAGGKTRSIPFLKNHLPENSSSIMNYYEPFLGAGSLFFSLTPNYAVLSDLNKELIECYKAIKKDPELISKYLSQHLRKNSENHYMEMRKKYNRSKNSISKAALFIYLNKTCFNGIWRVNKKGEFNVPYGHKEPPALPSKDHLKNVAQALSKAELCCKNYKEALKNADKGDFIYLDPPYPPLNETSNFAHYTKERFSKKDQEEVARVSRELSEKGCLIMISNSSVDFIRSLYKKGFNIYELELWRWIRADGKRYKIKEVVITNY